MRVLHVIPAVAPAYGGPSKVVRELAVALGRVGVVADIATTNADGDTNSAVPLGVAVNDQGAATYFFRRWSRSRYTWSPELARWLWGQARRYDLLHVSALFSFSTAVASRIAHHRRLPYLITSHGMLDPWALRQRAWKKWPYYRLIERVGLERAAGLHALTIEEGRQFGALGLSAPVFVIPNGVDPEEFQRLPARSEFESEYPQTKGRSVILFLGRIDAKKGLDLLLPAFAKLRERASKSGDPCLVVAGPDLVGYRGCVENLVRQQGLEEHVVFTGMLSGRAKLAAFAAADLFVLPSRSEGLPVAVLEAMAAGRAVIVTPGCNLPEIAERGAGFVSPMRITELTCAMSAVLSDVGLRVNMGKRGRTLVEERFSWESVARGIASVYSDVLAGRRESAAWL